jgi:hypothetical protein
VDTRLFHSTICHCLSTAPTTFQLCYGLWPVRESLHLGSQITNNGTPAAFSPFSVLSHCVSPRAIADSGYLMILIPRCRFGTGFFAPFGALRPCMLVPYFACTCIPRGQIIAFAVHRCSFGQIYPTHDPSCLTSPRQVIPGGQKTSSYGRGRPDVKE